MKTKALWIILLALHAGYGCSEDRANGEAQGDCRTGDSQCPAGARCVETTANDYVCIADQGDMATADGDLAIDAAHAADAEVLADVQSTQDAGMPPAADAIVHQDSALADAGAQLDTCANGEQNDGETDVDCGGTCMPCQAGLSCLMAADCVSRVCANGMCLAATCMDGVRNGDESDIDCDGGCIPCAERQVAICLERAENALPGSFGTDTAVCREDADCVDVQAELDVVHLLSDLGVVPNGVRGGVVTASFPLATCAAAAEEQDADCSVCVSCSAASPCPSLDITDYLADGFGGQTTVDQAALFRQMVWGDRDPIIYFRCADDASDFPACIPCPDPTSPCDQTDHHPCVTGPPLDPETNACAAGICAMEPFCCENWWDLDCVLAARQSAACDCAGAPLHSPCETGIPLDPAQSACVAAVCADEANGFCCNDAWDNACVAAARTVPECGCAACVPGEALSPEDSECAATVCALQPDCCEERWSEACVTRAEAFPVCGCQ